MCGRYQLTTKARVTAKHLTATLRADAGIFGRYNAAPSQTLPIVRLDEKGKRELVVAGWGLAPSWMKPKEPDEVPRGPINARSETAAEKPMFRTAIRKRRCGVPVTGFYEWQKIEGGPKQPYLFTASTKSAGGLFVLAGLWERWHDAYDRPWDSFAILTTQPNTVAAKVHDRMPVILDDGELSTWLDGDASREAVEGLMDPFPAGRMKAVAVSTRINKPANDDAAAAAPLN